MPNQGEYGEVLRARVGVDVSTNIGLTFILQPQSGETITRTESDGVVVGTVDVVVGDETYNENQYLEYVTLDGDIDYVGRWRKQARAKLSPTVERVGDFERFEVLA